MLFLFMVHRKLMKRYKNIKASPGIFIVFIDFHDFLKINLNTWILNKINIKLLINKLYYRDCISFLLKRAFNFVGST